MNGIIKEIKDITKDSISSDDVVNTPHYNDEKQRQQRYDNKLKKINTHKHVIFKDNTSKYVPNDQLINKKPGDYLDC